MKYAAVVALACALVSCAEVPLVAPGALNFERDSVGHVEFQPYIAQDAVGHIESGAVVISDGAFRAELNVQVPPEVLEPVAAGVLGSAELFSAIGKYAVDEGVKAGVISLNSFSEKADMRIGQFVIPVWTTLGLGAVALVVLSMGIYLGMRRIAVSVEKYEAMFEKDKLSEIRLQEARFTRLETMTGVDPLEVTESSEENGGHDSPED